MKQPKFPFNQTLVSAFLVAGAVVISAVAFNYAGIVDLEFGVDGIRVQVDGRENLP